MTYAEGVTWMILLAMVAFLNPFNIGMLIHELVCADILPDCFLNGWPLSWGVCGIVSRHQKSNYCLICRDMNPYWNRYLIIEDEGKPTWSKKAQPQKPWARKMQKKTSKHTCKQKSKKCNFWKFFFAFSSFFFVVFFLNFLSSDRRPSQKCQEMHNSRICIFFRIFLSLFFRNFFAIHFCLLFIIVLNDTALKR